MPPESEPAHGTRVFSTQRLDLWWLEPLTLFLILGGFIVYATFRVFENAHFVVDSASAGYHYLSPFGTPDLTPLVPAFMHSIPVLGPYMSYPAFLILPFPAGFRFTCYYYRKVYYRSLVSRPAACATEAARGKNYKGEKGLMIFQNLHRYFMYAALVITIFLAYDAIRSIWTPHGFYLGIGSIIMLVNVVFLTAYTLGCHSIRHLIGGRMDCFSCDAISLSQHSMWKGVTKLNQKHGRWAMLSLFSVALTDLYIRWVSTSGTTTILGVPV